MSKVASLLLGLGLVSAGTVEQVLARELALGQVPEVKVATLSRSLSEEASVKVEIRPLGEVENLLIPEPGLAAIDELTTGLRHVGELRYAEMQRALFAVFVDQVWELYDLYFPMDDVAVATTNLTSTSTSTPTPVPTPTPSPVFAPESQPESKTAPALGSYESERDRFLVVFLNASGYIADAAGAGVIGNLAYDILKDGLNAARVSARGKNKDRYNELLRTLERLEGIIPQVEGQGEGIYTRELAAKCTEGNLEKAKAWAKALGWTHRRGCSWHASKTAPHSEEKAMGR